MSISRNCGSVRSLKSGVFSLMSVVVVRDGAGQVLEALADEPRVGRLDLVAEDVLDDLVPLVHRLLDERVADERAEDEEALDVALVAAR